jgi:hypothetical protein
MRAALLLASIFVLSCPSTESPGLPPGPDEPVKSLAQLDAFADRVQIEAIAASWRAATEPQSSAKPRPFGILPLLLLSDAEVAALNSRLDTPAQRRCLRAIHSMSLQMQSEANDRVSATLAAIADLRRQVPDLNRMFTDEPDISRRKQVWFSQAHAARALAPLMRQLIAARQQWASQRSRRTYLSLMREHRGYDPDRVDILEASVRYALESTALPKSHPWEFESADPLLAMRMAARFDKSHCVQRATFILQYLGLPANSPALQVRETGQTAFSSFASYPVDPPTDHRVTVRSGAGIVPHWSAFHEYGHAAVSLLVVPTSCRTLKRSFSPAVAESCAKIAERLFYSEEWLRSQGVPPSEIQMLRNWERQSELMRVRGILADMEFERVMYQNPAEDLMGQYIAIERRTAGVDVGREFPAWALKRDLAFEPLSRVDYLLARCGQAAVYRRLRALPGGLMGEPARRFMREQVFRGATESSYEEWFRRATGTEPNCTAWLHDIAQVN